MAKTCDVIVTNKYGYSDTIIKQMRIYQQIQMLVTRKSDYINKENANNKVGDTVRHGIVMNICTPLFPTRDVWAHTPSKQKTRYLQFQAIHGNEVFPKTKATLNNPIQQHDDIDKTRVG